VTEAEGSTSGHGTDAGATAARGADAGEPAGQLGADAAGTPPRDGARPGDDLATNRPTRVGAGPGDNLAANDLPRADAPQGRGVAAGRVLRADARRNRARVLEAAEAAFASKGTSASTEEIARDAGVGIGTVFRHFPTKEALLEAVVVGRLERLAAEAASLATAEDPGSAFFSFFASAVDRSATKIALADALAAAGVDVERAAAEVGRELRRTMGVLLGRAQAVGAVREDATVADVIALLVGASRAAEHAGWDRGVQTRTVAIMLDGLRPAGGR
jgi:AcrR family transcriptional regulator